MQLIRSSWTLTPLARKEHGIFKERKGKGKSKKVDLKDFGNGTRGGNWE